MGGLEDFSIFQINCLLTNMTLKISQPDLITKMTQEFNEGVKSLITFNTIDTPHKGGCT